LFRGQSGTCASHGNTDDVGWCVDITVADPITGAHNSWMSVHPGVNDVLITQWGIFADNNATDYSTPFQNAINDLCTLGVFQGRAQNYSGTIRIPAGGGSAIALRSGVTTCHGIKIVGASRSFSVLCACTGDSPVITLADGFAGLEHLTIWGTNASGVTTPPIGPAVTNLPGAGGTFGAHFAALIVSPSAVGYTLNDIEVTGGFYSIYFQAGDGRAYNVGAHGGYGDANIRVGDAVHATGGFWQGLSMDTSVPGSAFPAPGTTISAWIGTHTYAANDIVTVTNAVSTYWLQTPNGGTTGSVAPAVPNMGATTNDNGVLWGFFARTDNMGLEIDGAASEVYIENSDFSGGYGNAIGVTKRNGGSGSVFFKCIECLPSGGLDTQVLIDAGANIQFDTMHTGSPVQPGFAGLQISGNFTGKISVSNSNIQGLETAVIADPGAGGQVEFTGNTIANSAATTNGVVFISQSASASGNYVGNTLSGTGALGYNLQTTTDNVIITNNTCVGGITTCDANGASGNHNIIGNNTGDTVNGVSRVCRLGLDANQANHDNQFNIWLPRSGLNWRAQSLLLGNASVSLTAATFGAWSGTGASGTNLVAGATALSPLTAAAINTAGSLMVPTVVNSNTALFNFTSFQLRTQTAQGAPATFDACFLYNVFAMP
jgi:hypothetical protein